MKTESVVALFAGALAGFTLGILFAPEKGEVTRAKIKKNVSDGYDYLKTNTENLIEQGKEKFDEKSQALRNEIEEIKEGLAKYGNDIKESTREKLLQQLNKLEAALSKSE